MTQEIEVAVIDGLGSPSRSLHHSLPLGAPCPNCAARIEGPWCHGCGQKADAYQRSVRHLIAEALEGLTHADGRIWRTLPRLFFKPGDLTRDYLEGKRASQIPPFRLFLVVLVIVFFAGGTFEGADDLHIRTAERSQIRPGATGIDSKLLRGDPNGSRLNRWMTERARYVNANPGALRQALDHWSHRFAILMLPVAALLLCGIFAFRKAVYVFDHLIFAMHSLSFQGLLFSVVALGGLATPLTAWLFCLAPVHLFVHMRGVYRTGVFGTLVRMVLLFGGSVIAVFLLAMGLLFVGFATAH